MSEARVEATPLRIYTTLANRIAAQYNNIIARNIKGEKSTNLSEKIRVNDSNLFTITLSYICIGHRTQRGGFIVNTYYGSIFNQYIHSSYIIHLTILSHKNPRN